MYLQVALYFIFYYDLFSIGYSKFKNNLLFNITKNLHGLTFNHFGSQDSTSCLLGLISLGHLVMGSDLNINIVLHASNVKHFKIIHFLWKIFIIRQRLLF